MADKSECPGCGAYLSSVRTALRDGDPMPCCGLSHAAAMEITVIRETKANESVTRLAEDAITRADAAERELAKLRRWMQRVRSVVAENPME